MKEYLKNIIEPLLVDPQGLTIEESESENGKLFSVHVSKPDMGRVIGKGGETIKAVRTLMHTAGMRTSERANVKINEPLV